MFLMLHRLLVQWQTLASVTIPGLAINQIVKASRFAVARSPITVPALAAKWLPTAFGLGSIPLIIHPIDTAVDFAMDSTVRQWDFKSKLMPGDSSSNSSEISDD